MKYVKEITFYNHYLFGNQTIKFYDHNGKTFNTIVIIGENGGGKTALINYLYDILIKDSYTSTTAIPKESKVTIENTDSKLESEPDSEGIKHIIDELIIHKNTQGMQKIDFVSDGYIQNIVHGTKDSNNIHKYSVGGILTPAEISYIPTEDVRYVTSTTLDTAERYSEKDIAHSIEQLLVDIVNQDNQKIAKYAEDHRGGSGTAVRSDHYRRCEAADECDEGPGAGHGYFLCTGFSDRDFHELWKYPAYVRVYFPQRLRFQGDFRRIHRILPYVRSEERSVFQRSRYGFRSECGCHSRRIPSGEAGAGPDAFGLY